MRAYAVSVYFKCTEIACGRDLPNQRNIWMHGDEDGKAMTFRGIFLRIARKGLAASLIDKIAASSLVF